MFTEEEVREYVQNLTVRQGLYHLDVDEITSWVLNKIKNKVVNKTYLYKTIKSGLAEFATRPKLNLVEDLSDEVLSDVLAIEETGPTYGEILDQVLQELEQQMTPEEGLIFRLLARGYSVKQIVEELKFKRWKVVRIKKSLVGKIRELFQKYHVPFKKFPRCEVVRKRLKGGKK